MVKPCMSSGGVEWTRVVEVRSPVCVVYKLTRDDGLIYVGTSRKGRCLRMRLYSHSYGPKFKGHDFIWEILEYGDESILLREKHWIGLLGSFDPQVGLNCTPDGLGIYQTVGSFSTLRLKHTDKTRALIAAKSKGKTPWNKGKPATIEHRRNISLFNAAKGKPALSAKTSVADREVMFEEWTAANLQSVSVRWFAAGATT